MQPTVLRNVSPTSRCIREEIFGPVAPVMAFDDVDEAVALANDTGFGLIGYVFGADLSEALSVAERIETGMVFINQGGDSVAELPFGGVKRSGFGRELADLGIKEFVNQKLVVVGG